MAQNNPPSHTISSTQPTTIRPGDEWYNPSTNLLYKAVATDGTTVGWKTVALNTTSTVIADYILFGNAITTSQGWNLP